MACRANVGGKIPWQGRITRDTSAGSSSADGSEKITEVARRTDGGFFVSEGPSPTGRGLEVIWGHPVGNGARWEVRPSADGGCPPLVFLCRRHPALAGARGAVSILIASTVIRSTAGRN